MIEPIDLATYKTKDFPIIYYKVNPFGQLEFLDCDDVWKLSSVPINRTSYLIENMLERIGV